MGCTLWSGRHLFLCSSPFLLRAHGAYEWLRFAPFTVSWISTKSCAGRRRSLIRTCCRGTSSHRYSELCLHLGAASGRPPMKFVPYFCDEAELDGTSQGRQARKDGEHG